MDDTPTGCNGDAAFYQLDNGNFTSVYIDCENNTRDVIDLFYATGNLNFY